jgi:predicted deacylase
MIHTAIDLNLFPAGYDDAIGKWLSVINGLNADCMPFAIADPSAAVRSGWPLITQVACIGDPQAPKTLVLIAGTHGIEGFAGTAVQLDFLEQIKQARPPPDPQISVLFIHALTPWGYAWHRRCDQNGIDLNRNFVDFADLPSNPGFAELRPYLLDPDQQARTQAFEAFRQRYGRVAFEQAVSGGQYIDPLAPFYGGLQANHGHHVIDAVFERYQLADKQLAVIDIHTGLGPYAYGEIICDHPLDSAGLAAAKAWYGAAVAVPEQGTSSSVPKLGLLDYAWHRIMREGSCFVTLEFGTLGTEQLFDVLLKDHLFWAATPVNMLNRRRNDPEWQRQNRKVRNAMLAHFCPADSAWREAVIFRSRQVIRQAISGLLE